MGMAVGMDWRRHEGVRRRHQHAGAPIEHSYLIRPGTVSILTLSLHCEKVSVKCRVLRSEIYRNDTWSVGERNYVYRTGLKLVDVSEASQRLIGGYIRFLQGMTSEDPQR